MNWLQTETESSSWILELIKLNMIITISECASVSFRSGGSNWSLSTVKEKNVTSFFVIVLRTPLALEGISAQDLRHTKPWEYYSCVLVAGALEKSNLNKEKHAADQLLPLQCTCQNTTDVFHRFIMLRCQCLASSLKTSQSPKRNTDYTWH